jgi:hypothetical protein
MEIECDVGLGHEEVPFGKGELWITGGETGAEVVLPGLDCSFGGISSVDMWWDALEGDVVLFEGLLEFVGALLIVKDVEFWGKSVRL